MKKLALLMAALLTFTAIFTGCSSNKESGDLDAIKEKGYITVGVDDAFAPMGFRDDKGELVGFDIDLAKEAGKRMGVEVKFQVIDWSMKEQELNNGNIDLIWNGYSITDERKQKVNFTKPYMKGGQRIVVLADSPIKTKADIAGKTVSLQKESTAYTYVTADTEFTSKLKGGEPVQFDTSMDAFLDLEAKRSDAIVVGDVLARYLIKQRGAEKYRILDEGFGEDETGIGVRKGDTKLLEELDKVMDEMKNDGTYDKIYKKWMV